MDKEFLTTMEIIVEAIRETEYNAYLQLLGYLETDNELYITRRSNARELIKKLDPDLIRTYMELYLVSEK